MHFLGRLAIYLGVVLVAVGMIGGFGFMFAKAEHAAVQLLALVPIGFIALLLGTVVTQLTKPKETHRE